MRFRIPSEGLPQCFSLMALFPLVNGVTPLSPPHNCDWNCM